MQISEKDELNILGSSKAELKELLNRYFEPMDINSEQLRERVEISTEMYDIMLFFFSLVIYGQLSIDNAKSQLESKINDLVNTHDFDMPEYVEMLVYDIADKTYLHLNDDVKEGNVNYFTSATRALHIAENEANTIMNGKELQQAKSQGFTHKTWITMRDKSVRDSHKVMESDTIPIDSYFVLEDCVMLYPHDYLNGTPDQLANCRCTCQYS